MRVGYVLKSDNVALYCPAQCLRLGNLSVLSVGIPRLKEFVTEIQDGRCYDGDEHKCADKNFL